MNAPVDVAALHAGLVAAEPALSLALDEDQRDRLLRYLTLLQRWNATYNLTALREPGQMLTHHLLDCLAVVAPLQRQLGPAPAELLDVGSGGGLPGVVLAITVPQLRVSCVDAVAKKAAFVRQVAAELGLPQVQALHQRVEQVRGAYGVISSRAFATLADFTRLTRHALAPDGIWMAMKGRVPHDEITDLPSDIEVFHVEPLSVPGLDAERCIVWMRRRP